MKSIITGLILLGTTSTFAATFDNTVDASEIANAMARCPKEVSQLLSGRYYVSGVTGEVALVPGLTSTKTYTISTQMGGGFERITIGKTLTITRKITQPDPRIQDAPAKVEFACLLENSVNPKYQHQDEEDMGN